MIARSKYSGRGIAPSPTREILLSDRGQRKVIDFSGVDYDRIRKQQSILLAAHMLADDVSLGAVRFLLRVYPLFLDKVTNTGAAMARKYGCSTQGALNFLHELQSCGYIERQGYRDWAISESYLTYLNKA